MTINLAGFIAVVAIAYLVPGPDFLIVTRYSARNTAAGRASALGAQAGLCVHMLVAASGLSALLIHSSYALAVVKLLGAAYLIWLGSTTLWRSLRERRRTDNRQGPDTPSERGNEAIAVSVGSAFRAGCMTNLLNPKAMLFFASVLPQFVDPSAPILPQVLLLALLDIVLGVAYWLVVIGMARKLIRSGSAAHHREWWERTCGAALVAAGAALARAGV
ncbi:LysE family translocator [Chelativorans sp. YIM 93263]|uniref:LysE family translocator n=1 Tax=Chelativorans sp. YIM 93263 TaxID=2906648 RepID=UPI002378A354|nr:LysE family translocator [Chelativorans sp. YIM 93263]